jgi:hypothetical protein
MTSLNLQLPPEGVLKPDDDHDPLPYYYNRWVGWLYRHRLQMGLDLLPAGGSRMLEVGVGSGVLVPTLTARYREYTGTDLTLAPGLDTLVARDCAAKFLRADSLLAVLTIVHPLTSSSKARFSDTFCFTSSRNASAASLSSRADSRSVAAVSLSRRTNSISFFRQRQTM